MMMLAFFLIRLCLAALVGWIAFRLLRLFSKYVADPFLQRVILGSRSSTNNLDPKLQGVYRAEVESGRLKSYFFAAMIALLVFVVLAR